MKTEKMSLGNLKKLSRKEMKSVMAGTGYGGGGIRGCISSSSCSEGCMELEHASPNGVCSGCCIA
jgi:hypothetical protein